MRTGLADPAGRSCRPRNIAAADLIPCASKQDDGRPAQEKENIDEHPSAQSAAITGPGGTGPTRARINPPATVSSQGPRSA